MGWKKILLWVVIIVAILFFLLAIFSGNKDKEPDTKPEPEPPKGPEPPVTSGTPDEIATAPHPDEKWQKVQEDDVPWVSNEWTTPKRLAVNDRNWEDGVYISGDGMSLYFTYYPGPHLLADVATGEFIGRGLDVYVSKRPFKTKKKFTDYYLSEDIASEGGIMIDPDGNIFYNSNRRRLEGIEIEDDVYMNDKLLPLSKVGGYYNNPHYCKAKDKFYVGDEDEHIFVLKDAAANNFDGQRVLVDPPINIEGSRSLQPFLTPDCETMYFVTSRDGSGPAIFKSKRNGDAWGEPKLVVKGKTGVGEPTLTDDEEYLFFLGLSKDEEGNVISDMFYTKRK